MLPSLIARFGEGGPKIEGVGLPRLAERGLNGGGFRMTLRGFMAAVRSMGPRYMLLTDGIEGAYLGTKEELMFCPALKVQVAGTAGAGDAFTSTFATFIAFGSKPEQALHAATVNAASVVSYVDTQTGLLPRAEIEKRVAARASEMPVQRWELRSRQPALPRRPVIPAQAGIQFFSSRYRRTDHAKLDSSARSASVSMPDSIC